MQLSVYIMQFEKTLRNILVKNVFYQIYAKWIIGQMYSAVTV